MPSDYNINLQKVPIVMTGQELVLGGCQGSIKRYSACDLEAIFGIRSDSKESCHFGPPIPLVWPQHFHLFLKNVLTRPLPDTYVHINGVTEHS